MREVLSPLLPSEENKALRRLITCPIRSSCSGQLFELCHSFHSLFMLTICKANLMATLSGWSFSQSDTDRPTSQLPSIYSPWSYSQTSKDFSEKRRLGRIAAEGCRYFLNFDSHRGLNLRYLQEFFFLLVFAFTVYFIGIE